MTISTEERNDWLDILRDYQAEDDCVTEYLSPSEWSMPQLRLRLRQWAGFSKYEGEEDEDGEIIIEDLSTAEWGVRADMITDIIEARKAMRFSEEDLDFIEGRI